MHDVPECRIDQSVTPPVGEAHCGIVTVLNLSHGYPRIDRIVWKIEPCPERIAAAASRKFRRVEIKAAEFEHFLAQEVRGSQLEIQAGGLTFARPLAIAPSDDSPNVGLLPETPARSKRCKVFCWPRAVIARTDLEHTEVERSSLSRELRSVIDRLRDAKIIKADPTAEKRHNSVARLAREIEDTFTFEKECALLGKEQRESCQIHLPLIDFGLREVGVQ